MRRAVALLFAKYHALQKCPVLHLFIVILPFLLVQCTPLRPPQPPPQATEKKETANEKQEVPTLSPQELLERFNEAMDRG